MKKLLSILLAVMLLLSTCPMGLFGLTANAATATSGTTGDCTWTLDGTVLTISGNGSMGDYVYYHYAPWGTSITEVIINDGVTSIGNYAFYDCSGLTSVTIPDGVTSIGNYAFYDCSGLTSVTIPDDVTSIGNSAFSGCSNLKYNTYENGKYLGNENNKYLALIDTTDTDITNFKFADGVKIMGGSAFSGCSGLTSVTIPNGVTSIGNYAFYSCSGLTSVTIPNGVTSIGNYAFEGCSGLTSVSIPNGVTSIGNRAFYICSCLTSVTIPDSVTSIGDSAFGCSGLTSVSIPNGVTSIGNSAFSSCSGLTSVTIPDGVTSIGDSAFSGCSGLTSVSIPNGVTSIGYNAFYNCRGLTSINIPDGVTSIGYNAFYNCRGLTSITIPDSVTSIGDSAFEYCTNLKELSISSKTVPIDTFKGCSRIEKIYFSKNLTVIYNNAFANANKITDIYYEGTEEEWKNVVIQHSNGSISTANVYYNCTEIPSDILSVEICELPEKLRYIEKRENLDLTGGTVKVTYTNGAIQKTDMTKLTVTGFDNSRLGECELTVKYEKYSLKFKVEIVERPISFAAIAKAPKKQFYLRGEAFDVKGGKIALGYDDGSYELIDMTADMISGYNSQVLGVQMITVNYRGNTSMLSAEVYIGNCKSPQ